MVETTVTKIETVYDSMKSLSLYKNEKYGNSALAPKNIFSKLTSDEQIRVRLDDKLSRIMNASELRKNDVSDVIGYLTLLCIAHGWLNFDEFKD
jgi:hypothetical protein